MPAATRPGREAVTVKVWVLVVVLLGIFAAQNVIEMRRESCTSDEVIHLPAGLSYLLKRDFRLNPEHPPLLKLFCAIPLMALHPKMDFNDPEWTNVRQLQFGFDFLYSNDADRLLFIGRLPIVAITTWLGFVVFRWAQQLYGSLAGLMALTLYAFSPNVIAHSHYVTTDMGVTAFLTIAFYEVWRCRELNETGSLYWAGLAMGAALASKFSAVVFFPLAAFLLWIFFRTNDDKGKATVANAGRSAGSSKANPNSRDRKKKQRRAHSAAAGFWKSLFHAHRRRVTEVLIFVGLACIVAQLAYLGSPDLSLYFKGLDRVNENHNPEIPFYWHGELKVGGWWYYFLAAFLVKATAPLILLFLSRLVVFFRNLRKEWRTAMYLLLPVLVYVPILSARADPLGLRYLLPIFPFVIIFSSGLVKWLTAPKKALVVVWILLGWHITTSVVAFPNHISYFNEFVGGPSHGIHWLSDSNVDWGEELKNLKRVLEKHGIHRITLHSFSKYDNPAYYGIDCYNPTAQEWYDILLHPHRQPGIYVVSAHWLAIQRALGFDWIKEFPVIDRLGYSMFVFQIP